MRKEWTSEEDRILLDNSDMSVADIQQKLIPYRNIASIGHRWLRIRPENAQPRPIKKRISPNKMSKEQVVDMLLKECGAVMTGDYYGTEIPTTFICDKCGMDVLVRPHSVKSSKRPPLCDECSRHWTYEEDKYLLDHYLKTSTKKIANVLKRTVKSINSRWKKIKPLGSHNKNAFTKEDNRYILENYLTTNIHIMEEKLGRSGDSIQQQWSKIKPKGAPKKNTSKYKLPRKSTDRYHVWTPEEDNYILENYYTQSIQHMSEYLGVQQNKIQHRWPNIKPAGCLNKNQWTSEEEQYLLSHYLNTPRKELCHILQRKPEAITAKWLKLRPNQIFKHRKTEQEVIDLATNICVDGYHGKYISGHITNVTSTRTDRYQFECPVCGYIFNRTLCILTSHNSIFCTKCSQDRQSKSMRLTIEQVRQIIRERNFKWIAGEYNNVEDKLTLQCRCGKIFQGTIFNIKYSKVKTCGHCNDPEIGDTWGDLTAVIVFPNSGGSCSVVCQCKCGEYTRSLRLNELLRSNGKGQKTCGKCNLKRNGVLTSTIALRLHNIVEKILNTKCKHNKRIGTYYVDIVSEEHKIAIEYDGYYWHRIHRDTSKEDIKRDRYLLREGYKVFRIQSDGTDLPSEKELTKVLLNHFQHGVKKKTMKMPSWKKAEKKYGNK